MQAAALPSHLTRWLTVTGSEQTPRCLTVLVFALLSLGGVFSVGCFSLVLTDFQAVELSAEHWKAILYLGGVASGLGFFLWNKRSFR